MTAPPDASDTSGSASQKDASKLMEEVKLWWQIQIAMMAVLGFLGSHLSIQPAGPAGTMTNVILSLVALSLFTIGAIYNLVGSYYIRLEGVLLSGTGQPHRRDTQEDFTTFLLAWFYLFISGLIAATGFYPIASHQYGSGTFTFHWCPFLKPFGVAFACQWLVGCFTYRELSGLYKFDRDYFWRLCSLGWPCFAKKSSARRQASP